MLLGSLLISKRIKPKKTLARTAIRPFHFNITNKCSLLKDTKVDRRCMVIKATIVTILRLKYSVLLFLFSLLV